MPALTLAPAQTNGCILASSITSNSQFRAKVTAGRPTRRTFINQICHRLISLGLLAFLAAINVAPVGSLFIPARSCECGCPGSAENCCCKRSAHKNHSGSASWLATRDCGNACRCAAGIPSHSGVMMDLRRTHWRVEQGTEESFCPPDAPRLSRSDYLAYLFERPPPTT